MNWHPSATLSALQQRAAIITRIRDFFKTRGILEVDTPLMASTSVTDLHLHSLSLSFQPPGFTVPRTLYLQTSPEYAMKRLLAAGCGPIYQICKAFRADSPGSHHNPEFTMLEWYRPGFDHHALMDEMDELLQMVLSTPSAERIRYADAFVHATGLDPHSADTAALAAFGKKTIAPASPVTHRNDWLDLIMSQCIEPGFQTNRPVFIYDFPASQAALAKVRHDESPPVASRFEVYCGGMELANGFHELQDAKEQRRRFEADLSDRAAAGLPAVPLDERFLQALEHGLPDCAGVALGIDRLIMLATGSEKLRDVLSFDFEAVSE